MSEPFWVPLGSVPIDYKGDYAAGTAYAAGDVVRYNGVAYLAVNPSQGSTPPVASPLGITADAAWRYIGQSGQPAFQNGWSNYDGGASPGTQFPHARFRKDALGWVHLSGLIKPGTLSAVGFTMPVGYRPSHYLHTVGAAITFQDAVRINSNGEVTPSIAGTAPTWVSLDGILFLGEL